MTAVAPKVYRFTYPSEVESEALMFSDLKRMLSDNEVTALLGRNFILCISEAFSNALVHGNRLDKSKAITIHLEVNPDQLYADIEDEGKGGLERIRDRGTPTDSDEGGRGIDLIRRYADTVEIDSTPTGGLRIQMHFARDIQAHKQVDKLALRASVEVSGAQEE